MSRIRRGWALSKKSWALLREHRELVRFPLYGAAATIVCAAIVVGPGVYLIEDGKAAFGGPLAVIGFYLLALIGFYFSVGLAAAADMIFHGREATVADGLAVARERFSQIAGWAAISTVVGLVLGALENQGMVGQIAGRLLAVGWSLITFLAAPVIALEGTGPIETLKRSASLFKSRWGQQVTGNLAIGGAVFLLGVLPSAALIGLGILVWATTSFVGALLVVLGVIGFAVAMLISSALSGIFGVALYRYALDGEAVGGFTADELESAVRTKRGRNAPPTATPGTV
jgi:MFS family permease